MLERTPMKLQEIKNLENSSNYSLLIDIDGVLADFEKGVETLLNEPYDNKKYEADSKYRKQMWDAVRRYSAEGGELWYELPLMPDAMTLWNYVKKYNPEILSATGDPKYGADSQKRRWIAEHFGSNVKVNLTRKAADKAQHAAPNRILIDDKMKAIRPWREAGGIGILHTSAANTIRQLKELGL